MGAPPSLFPTRLLVSLAIWPLHRDAAKCLAFSSVRQLHRRRAPPPSVVIAFINGLSPGGKARFALLPRSVRQRGRGCGYGPFGSLPPAYGHPDRHRVGRIYQFSVAKYYKAATSAGESTASTHARIRDVN